MSIYHDLEAIKMMAIEATKDDGYNYNVILNNPNDKGEFDLSVGSTYEFVADSYFNKPRPNIILLHKTKDLLQAKEVDKMITGILQSAVHRAEMEQHFGQLEVQATQLKKNHRALHKVNKLNKELSTAEVKADGVNYTQGRAGLERVTNTNRNDKCNCGSGKKFKKCCGK